MSYSSRNSKYRTEYASKSSHSNIISDDEIKKFLQHCTLPHSPENIDLDYDHRIFYVDYSIRNPVNNIAAIDGGYSEIMVKKEYPSSLISFYQYGILIFKLKDYEKLSEKPFIDPADIKQLKELERYKFVLPSKNVSYNGESIINSVRNSFYEFFMRNYELMNSLKWFLYREYKITSTDSYNLSTCPNPNCSSKNISLDKSEISNKFTFTCDDCGDTIYLTDVFRLHEGIDNELGAGGILSYVTNLLEQMLLIHAIRLFIKNNPSTLLKETLFIKDGPLAFFGYTANMHKPMRDLTNFLLDKYDLMLAGIEKNGAFVEHAEQIKSKLDPGTVLLLDNDYIYKNIIPGQADPSRPYASTSYYGGKLIFKSRDGRLYVITLPVSDEQVVLEPKKEDFQNLDVILANLEKLKCNMYENSLVPVALANKLVSLSEHPSSEILEKFAKKEIR